MKMIGQQQGFMHDEGCGVDTLVSFWSGLTTWKSMIIAVV